jgi:putative N-acetyltransferase (TIGR04045 family)
LRPVPGTRIETLRPPSPSEIQPVYEAVAAIIQQKGLASANCKAGCVRCGACSALNAYERPAADIVYHSARTAAEIEAAMAIRHAVFVCEQKIFHSTDVDAHDATCSLIVAKKGETVVGTVRVYPQNENGHWIGGRLAVRSPYRAGNVGAQLVKEAIKHVQRKECKVFTAHIQQLNVPFFEKIGWKCIGPIEDYMGRPHQLMQADLKPEEPS